MSKLKAFNRQSAYQWYLTSAFWRERRIAAFRRAKGLCERCNFTTRPRQTTTSCHSILTNKDAKLTLGARVECIRTAAIKTQLVQFHKARYFTSS